MEKEMQRERIQRKPNAGYPVETATGQMDFLERLSKNQIPVPEGICLPASLFVVPG